MKQCHTMMAAACIPAPTRPARFCRAMSWRMALTAAVFSAAPGAVHAQLLAQYYPSGIPGYESWFSDAVLDRPRGEYDPIGVRVGNFVVRPSLSQGFGYNSNVFGTAQAQGSALSETQGNVSATSDWSRNALDATIGFDRLQYLRYPSASTTNWTAGLGGTVDIGQDHATLSYIHATNTTAAAQIGNQIVGQPITISIDSARASYQAGFGQFTLEPALEASVNRFTNVLVGGLPATVNNNNSFTGSLTAGYALAPGSSLVLVASGTNTEYTTKAPGLPTPDYNDVSLVGGIDYRSGSVFRYRATIGYEVRTYINTSIPGTSAPLAELDVIWSPTRLTTVTGQVSNSIQNTIAQAGVIGYTYTNVRVTVDHEYRRNLLLQAYGEFENAAFNASNETQHVVSAGASATWLLNPKLSLVGRLTYARSTDNVNAALNQTESLAELSLNFHL